MWQPIETAPTDTVVDVLFDPSSYEMPEFYCPAGATTGLWRITDVIKDQITGRWFMTAGLKRISGMSIQAKLTHWSRLPKPPKH